MDLKGPGPLREVRLYGDDTSNVINNTGDIDIAGYVTAHGRHHFANVAGVVAEESALPA